MGKWFFTFFCHPSSIFHQPHQRDALLCHIRFYVILCAHTQTLGCLSCCFCYFMHHNLIPRTQFQAKMWHPLNVFAFFFYRCHLYFTIALMYLLLAFLVRFVHIKRNFAVLWLNTVLHIYKPLPSIAPHTRASCNIKENSVG